MLGRELNFLVLSCTLTPCFLQRSGESERSFLHLILVSNLAVFVLCSPCAPCMGKESGRPKSRVLTTDFKVLKHQKDESSLSESSGLPCTHAWEPAHPVTNASNVPVHDSAKHFPVCLSFPSRSSFQINFCLTEKRTK